MVPTWRYSEESVRGPKIWPDITAKMRSAPLIILIASLTYQSMIPNKNTCNPQGVFKLLDKNVHSSVFIFVKSDKSFLI